MAAASHFSINVSKNGKHVFATQSEFWSHKQAFELVRLFRSRFLAVEGYEITLSYWECTGRDVDVPREIIPGITG